MKNKYLGTVVWQVNLIEEQIAIIINQRATKK